jgi:UDP-N-acetylglucosamine transferase subunit ALG13
VIFVTLGTHEQPMLRLVTQLTKVAATLPDRRPFFIQHGYSPLPEGWTGAAFLTGREMDQLIRRSTVLICHGGRAKIAEVRARGRVPIVVPRIGSGEHVDDHQLWFARRLAAAKEVLAVEDVTRLVDVAANYDQLIAAFPPPGAVDPAPAIRKFREQMHSFGN